MNWPMQIHLIELSTFWRILLFTLLALACMPLR